MRKAAAAPSPPPIALAPAPAGVRVSVTYRERILVPAGSRIVMTVAGGPEIVRPIESGPPYVSDLPVPANTRFPLTVSVRIESAMGHRLTGSAQIAGPDQTSIDILASSALTH